MSWAQRRKATYLSGIILFFIIIILIIVVPRLFKTATCFDGIKNQSEIGIDCGGPCQIICRAEYSDPIVQWVRWAKVTSSGTYNVLAYIENPNIGSGAYDAPYNFKIYDKDGVLLFEKYGNAYIPPNKKFAIFEDGINLLDKTPSRINFTFTTGAVWQKMDNRELGIVSDSNILSKESLKPRLDSVIRNKTLRDIKDIEVIAILYDSNNNAVAFSRTKIDLLDKESTQNIVFTWPEPFSGKVYRIETISKILGK
ncbi:MAG: hypothetical protein WC631_02300 [Candidatus Paceibacterota bacterium]|jgi:hypothetical protein